MSRLLLPLGSPGRIRRAVPPGPSAPPAGLITGEPAHSYLFTSGQVGYDFTPSEDLTATALRTKIQSVVPERIRLWRDSDQLKLAELDVVSVPEDWAEVELLLPITLSAGVKYIVTTQWTTGASRSIIWESVAGYTFDSRITYHSRRSAGASTFPSTSSVGNIAGVADVVVEAAPA